MGAFAFTDEMLDWIGKLVGESFGGDPPIMAGLFINDFTPVPGWGLADITEPGVDGYARQEVSGADWSRGFVAHTSIITASETAVFTTTDPIGELCYGYFLFWDDQDFFVDAQRFEEPQLLVLGVPIIFTPRMRFKNCPDV